MIIFFHKLQLYKFTSSAYLSESLEESDVCWSENFLFVYIYHMP